MSIQICSVTSIHCTPSKVSEQQETCQDSRFQRFDFVQYFGQEWVLKSEKVLHILNDGKQASKRHTPFVLCLKILKSDHHLVKLFAAKTQICFTQMAISNLPTFFRTNSKAYPWLCKFDNKKPYLSLRQRLKSNTKSLVFLSRPGHCIFYSRTCLQKQKLKHLLVSLWKKMCSNGLSQEPESSPKAACDGRISGQRYLSWQRRSSDYTKCITCHKQSDPCDRHKALNPSSKQRTKLLRMMQLSLRFEMQGGTRRKDLETAKGEQWKL